MNISLLGSCVEERIFVPLTVIGIQWNPYAETVVWFCKDRWQNGHQASSAGSCSFGSSTGWYSWIMYIMLNLMRKSAVHRCKPCKSQWLEWSNGPRLSSLLLRRHSENNTGEQEHAPQHNHHENRVFLKVSIVRDCKKFVKQNAVPRCSHAFFFYHKARPHLWLPSSSNRVDGRQRRFRCLLLQLRYVGVEVSWRVDHVVIWSTTQRHAQTGEQPCTFSAASSTVKRAGKHSLQMQCFNTAHIGMWNPCKFQAFGKSPALWNQKVHADDSW